jgi:hypothetical protein
LHYAATHGRVDALRLLMQSGANVAAITKVCPLSLAFKMRLMLNLPMLPGVLLCWLIHSPDFA